MTAASLIPSTDQPAPRGAGRSALVLLSGGQDSTTCLFWALSPRHGGFDRVEAVAFDYGQRHAVELRQAERIARIAGVPFRVLDLTGLLGGSALTSTTGDVSAAHESDENLPASFVPGRNALFLTLAATYAYTNGPRSIDGALHLIGGMCETDYSGYPDCRQDFIDSQQTTLSLALDAPVRIHTPLMTLTKAETWKLAAELGEHESGESESGESKRGARSILEIIVEETHTDYNGDRSQRNDWGYGRLDNPASVLRAKGWEEARAKGWV
jgi:7-cyano-7-deazaguanine synthase